MTANSKITPEELAEFCAAACSDKLAADVAVLKLAGDSSVADYFVLCSADSEPHLRAVVNHLERTLREKHAIRPRRVSGEPESGWILVDCSDVVIHIMTGENRRRYDLESLWGDSPESAALDKLRKKS